MVVRKSGDLGGLGPIRDHHSIQKLGKPPNPALQKMAKAIGNTSQGKTNPLTGEGVPSLTKKTVIPNEFGPFGMSVYIGNPKETGAGGFKGDADAI